MKLNTKLEGHNGYRSWNSWNVSLWLDNDRSLYEKTQGILNSAEELTEKILPAASTKPDVRRRMVINKAVMGLLGFLTGEKTPDGARFNAISIREHYTKQLECRA
jgi:hypothetical protein